MGRDPSAVASGIERELKFSVPPSFRLPRLGGVGSVTRATARSTTTFFDTPDLALAGWGCLLRYRTREGWTVKVPGARAGRGLERLERTLAGPGGTPPAAALELLAVFLRGRRVVPVATMSTLRRSITIVDGNVELIEIDDDSVRPGRHGRAFREVEVELRHPGAGDVRDAAVRALTGAGARPADGRTKYDRVLGSRRPKREIVVAKITPRSSCRDVVRATVADLVSQLMLRDPYVRVGEDPEAVHQARVLVRRLRSDLLSFRPVLDRGWTDGLRSELGRLGETLGTVRDLLVLAERLRSDGRRAGVDVGPIVGGLEREIRGARSELAKTMRSQRYFTLVGTLVEAARVPRLAVADGPAADLLRTGVIRQWERAWRARMAVRPGGTAAQLHRMRIEAKRLRYTCEAVSPVFGEPAARLARAANELQDVLGAHQDAVVAQTWLRTHTRATDAATELTLRKLTALQTAARTEARKRWPGSWAKLDRWRPSTWT